MPPATQNKITRSSATLTDSGRAALAAILEEGGYGLFEAIASKIIEIAKIGERNPDLLCERLERYSPTSNI
jgi:hypothetical protein